MIDNLELLTPLLKFKREGDFYMLYVMKRKKDQPVEERSNHQSVRTIKTYCIDSLHYLSSRWEEIKMLCEVFKARAYIHVLAQNHNDVTLAINLELAQRMKDGVKNQQNLFNSVVGQLKVSDKLWVIDIDDKAELDNIIEMVTLCRPVGAKIECIVPTKQGVHLITKRFDKKEFIRGGFGHINIQTRNPTLLYYPDSLNDKNEKS